MAGEIIALGDEVTGWSIGDRVSSNFSIDHVFGDVTEHMKTCTLGGPIDGVLQKYRVFEETGLVPKPANISYEEAATLPCAGVTAFRALYGFKPLEAGHTVLVQGTGGVSIFALQVSR